MATTWPIEPMKIARTGNDSPPLRNDQYLEDASQSYSKYDPVQLETTSQQLEIYEATHSRREVVKQMIERNSWR